ncbi:MAG: transposase [Phycisphaerae bacterium]|nr:transposase [Phycisphaerae bacterium]
MPRQARLDAPGLLQHVVARGIERRKIFWDDQDRQSFLERLALILDETQTQCYAWALIPNHFHLLLRTSLTPLSKVMRRLMTGYAVTFNKRHKRSGHLFQNRYKSVVCEEDPYLLELIRYIHLNPLRAGLVKDLKELDKYPWTGHSAILGKRKNPFVPKPHPNDFPFAGRRIAFSQFRPETEKATINPENPACPVGAKHRTGVKNKPLAEKTIEDVLLQFGDKLREARRRYRHFVKQGVDQGSRPELQGGGLVRSAGGDKRGLLGRKKEEHELGDARILGSGDFVANVMKDANEVLDQTSKFNISLDELISRVCAKFEIRVKDLVSRSRKRYISQARGVVCYLAVDELGYSGDDVARSLRISGRGVGDCRERGKKILDKPEIIGKYLA